MDSFDYIKDYEDLADKYEQLLEDLPQYKFSKAGTPPEWVINEIDENTYIKALVQDDIGELIKEDCTVEDLKRELKEYFEI